MSKVAQRTILVGNLSLKLSTLGSIFLITIFERGVLTPQMLNQLVLILLIIVHRVTLKRLNRLVLAPTLKRLKRLVLTPLSNTTTILTNTITHSYFN